MVSDTRFALIAVFLVTPCAEKEKDVDDGATTFRTENFWAFEIPQPDKLSVPT